MDAHNYSVLELDVSFRMNYFTSKSKSKILREKIYIKANCTGLLQVSIHFKLLFIKYRLKSSTKNVKKQDSEKIQSMIKTPCTKELK